MDQDTQKGFFISYNSADRRWAEWIAWQLEEEGYLTVIQLPDNTTLLLGNSPLASRQPKRKTER